MLNKQKRYADQAGIRELSEQELDAVIGGAATATPESWETVVDTTNARTVQEYHTTDGAAIKTDGTIKTDYGKGKNPHFHVGKTNVHTIDMTNLK